MVNVFYSGRTTVKLKQQGKMNPTSSALNVIFCNDWHTRIWTIQEASFSQDCHVVCGKCSISWDVYSKAARFLLYDKDVDDVDPRAYKSFIAIDMRNVLRDYLWGRVPLEIGASQEDLEDERDRRVVFLSSCLAQCNKLQATEPRDRIYGLHALYKNLGIELPTVDYAKPLARVYEEAAVSMIMWSRTLKVLGDASLDRASFPSWVPDYSDADIKSSVLSGDATRGSKITDKAATELSPRPGELRVSGKIVGRVEALRDKLPAIVVFPARLGQCELGILTTPVDGIVDEIDTFRLLVDKIRFFRQLYRLLQDNTEDNSDEAEDTFLDILRQKSYSEPSQSIEVWVDIMQYPDTTYSLKAGEDMVAKWQRAESAAGAKAPWTAELRCCATIAASLVSNQIQRDEHNYSWDILSLVSEASANLDGNALILVRLDAHRAATVATGVSLVQEGDSVVLLEGAEWPVVLREAGERKWAFIGSAFVPGIMSGELWPDDGKDGGKMTDLCDFCLV